MDVNDDCILAIFDCLSLSDLMSFSDTCLRFRALASEAFHTKHTSISLCADTEWSAAEPDGNLKTIEKIAKNFASLPNSLEFYIPQYPRDSSKVGTILDLFANCRYENLKALILQSLIFDKWAAELRPLFTHLNTLIIEDCEMYVPVSSMFIECRQLVKLRIEGEMDATFYLNYFPKLQHLDLKDIRLEGVEEQYLRRFFKNHNNLKYLRVGNLCVSNNVQLLDVILVEISVSCVATLHTLHLSGFIFNDRVAKGLQPLFSRLRTLNLYDCSFSASAHFHWNQLVKLDISHELSNMSKHHFPRLSSLVLRKIRDSMMVRHINPAESVTEFLTNHNQLKEITILDISTHAIPPKVLSKLEKLERFKTNSVYDLNAHFAQFKRIQKLKLYEYNCGQISDSIRNIVSVNSLVYLQLTNIQLDNVLINGITNFTCLLELHILASHKDETVLLAPLGRLSKLTALTLNGNISVHNIDMISLIVELMKLRRLTLSWKLDARTYDNIKEVVHNRNQSLTINTNNCTSFENCVDIEIDHGS